MVEEPRRGYGQAYLTGFAAAKGDYIVMIDADLTYDFEEIPRFVRELDRGAELVMGNRMQSIEPGAMSAICRIGNPILTGSSTSCTRRPCRMPTAACVPSAAMCCRSSSCARPGWNSPRRW